MEEIKILRERAKEVAKVVGAENEELIYSVLLLSYKDGEIYQLKEAVRGAK